jgi:CheY-like chemotaxis protein
MPVEERRVGRPALAESPDLVADDEQRNLEALATFLERAGFDATAAADVVEALWAALHLFSAIAIEDLELPYLDGDESSQRVPELPVC